MKLFYVLLFSVYPISSLYSQDSYTPLKMMKTLGALTKAKIILQSDLNNLINSKECKYLKKDRSYAAPVGLFPKNDVKNAAKGIDEWIEMDNGNAYVLTNYKWIPRDSKGATQLYVDFDSLSCNDK